jgi:N-acetylated-alpha-linked acidic dipeptidase
MRLADAELLPFDFSNFADTIHRYVDELKKLLRTKQDEARELNKEIEEGVFTATADPRKTFVPPNPEEIPPYLNFAPLENATDALTQSAQRYRKAVEKANANGGAVLASASLSSLNALLIQSERKLTSPQGLPGRAWYKHEIYAPGVYTGYGVKTIPAVRESIEQKKWKLADQGIIEVGKTLADEAAIISSAADELEKIAK